MQDLIEITARIELFKGEDVRQTPVVSGYRPLFDFPGAKTKISGKIDLIDMNDFSPGQKGVVKISFINGMISNDYFQKSVKFTFGEGMKDLGKGEVLG